MLNEHYNNIGVRGFFQRYGIWNGIRRATFFINPIHVVKDYEIKKVLWQKKASKHIERYIKYKDKDPEGMEYKFEDNIHDAVWFFWDSGIENAPNIVKACYETLKKYSGGTVITLNRNNVDNYVIFPEYIRKRVKQGNIPIAAYTDLLRFSLLEHYGGAWIDATVYLSGYLPSTIFKSDFFALRNSMMLVENPVLYPAWFLFSKTHNKTIREIRNVAFAYWTQEQHVVEYLLPNLIKTQIIQQDSKVESSIPYMDSDYSERLIRIIDELPVYY